MPTLSHFGSVCPFPAAPQLLGIPEAAPGVTKAIRAEPREGQGMAVGEPGRFLGGEEELGSGGAAGGKSGWRFQEKTQVGNSQQLLPGSTEPPPRGQHNSPGVRELKNRSKGSGIHGTSPKGCRQMDLELCKAGPCFWEGKWLEKVHPFLSLYLGWAEKLPRVPHPKMIPRTAFPVLNKGLESSEEQVLVGKCLP